MTDVEEFLERELDAGSFPGAVALVGTADAVVEMAAVGRSVVDPEKLAATPATVYDLASLTKPLVCGAVAAASFPDLDLSSPPGRYLPEWKATRYDGITLESFLVHTSGLPAWYPVYSRGEGAAAYRRTLASIEAEARPGERVIYSDLNFLLFGEVFEVHYSAPLDETFAAVVAARAGSAARFLPGRSDVVAATEGGDVTERRMAAEMGISYTRFRDGIVWGDVHDGNAYRRGGVAGNAGLFGSAADVWELARPWLDPARRELTRDRTPGLAEARGLAWQGRRGAGSAIEAMSAEAFGHTGFTGTSLWIDPDARRIAILLTNRVHPEVQPIDFNAVRRRFHEAVWH